MDKPSKLGQILLEFAPTDEYDSGMIDPQWESNQPALKAAIKSLMLDMVGKDEPLETFSVNDGYSQYIRKQTIEARNNFRAELREKIRGS